VLEIDIQDLNLDTVANWPLPFRIVLFAVTGLLIFFLAYWLDTSSQLEELRRYEKEEISLREVFEQKQQMSSNLELYKTQLAEMEKNFEAMLHFLPNKAEVPGLLEDISETGVASGLQFKQFDPLPTVNHDFYQELPMRIAVIGTYHQLATFISKVAQLNRIVTLHDFKLSPKDSDKSNTEHSDKSDKPVEELQMDITAKIYRYIGDNQNV